MFHAMKHIPQTKPNMFYGVKHIAAEVENMFHAMSFLLHGGGFGSADAR